MSNPPSRRHEITPHRGVKVIACLCAFLQFFAFVPGFAQILEPAKKAEGQTFDLTFDETPLATVLEYYGDIVEKTVIMAPNVGDITVTLQSHESHELTAREVLIAIETMLALNKINIEPFEEKFIRVELVDDAITQGKEFVLPGDPRQRDSEDTFDLISEVVELKNIAWEEAEPIIRHMVNPNAKVQPMERTSSFLITDSAVNVARIRKMLDYFDKPLTYSEETFIRQIKYAVASEIAGQIEELISKAAEDEEDNRNQRTTRPTTLRTSAGRTINVAQPNQPRPDGISAAAELAKQGIVQGKVQILSDDRTNKLIILTRKENMENFIDIIIDELDKEVAPEIDARVIQLEFAKAEEIAGLLNDLIGAATSSRDDDSANPNARADDSRDRSVSEILAARRNAAAEAARRRTAEGNQLSEADTASLGQISEDTNIIADERTNSILIMGRKQDIEVLERFIRELDIELEQVLVEVAILEVNLTDNLSYGLDWLQRSFTVNNVENIGPAGGLAVATPVGAFGGGVNNNGTGNFVDGATIDRNTTLGDGLSYFTTFYDLNIDAVLRLAGRSTDARVLSIPQIITKDNSEGQVTIGEQRPVPEASATTFGGVVQSQYTYRDIGISLTLEPRINPRGVVEMKIEANVDGVGGEVTIGGDQVPIITRKEFAAEISVLDGATIVLGGLVSEDTEDSESKVPILGDIPGLRYFFSSISKTKARRELLILITPTVLNQPMDGINETRRLHGYTEARTSPWERGWSASDLSLLPHEDYIMWKDEVRFDPTPRHVRDKRNIWEAQAPSPLGDDTLQTPTTEVIDLSDDPVAIDPLVEDEDVETAVRYETDEQGRRVKITTRRKVSTQTVPATQLTDPDNIYEKEIPWSSTGEPLVIEEIEMPVPPVERKGTRPEVVPTLPIESETPRRDPFLTPPTLVVPPFEAGAPSPPVLSPATPEDGLPPIVSTVPIEDIHPRGASEKKPRHIVAPRLEDLLPPGSPGLQKKSTSSTPQVNTSDEGPPLIRPSRRPKPDVDPEYRSTELKRIIEEVESSLPSTKKTETKTTRPLNGRTPPPRVITPTPSSPSPTPKAIETTPEAPITTPGDSRAAPKPLPVTPVSPALTPPKRPVSPVTRPATTRPASIPKPPASKTPDIPVGKAAPTTTAGKSTPRAPSVTTPKLPGITPATPRTSVPGTTQPGVPRKTSLPKTTVPIDQTPVTRPPRLVNPLKPDQPVITPPVIKSPPATNKPPRKNPVILPKSSMNKNFQLRRLGGKTSDTKEIKPVVIGPTSSVKPKPIQRTDIRRAGTEKATTIKLFSERDKTNTLEVTPLRGHGEDESAAIAPLR